MTPQYVAEGKTVQLAHDTDWTVVIEDPLGYKTLCRFEDEAHAQTALHVAKKCCSNNGAYVVPPTQSMMRRSV